MGLTHFLNILKLNSMVKRRTIVMMQIMRSILQIYLTTVWHTQKKQRLMNFSFLDTSRHAEEREFEVSGTNLVQLLSTKIVHFYDKSMKLCQITTNPKTNISGYGAKPNSTLDTNTAQALKWPT